MSSLSILPILKATWETIYMVFISGAIGLVLGLIVGIILFLTGKKQALQNKIVYSTLSFLATA